MNDVGFVEFGFLTEKPAVFTLRNRQEQVVCGQLSKDHILGVPLVLHRLDMHTEARVLVVQWNVVGIGLQVLADTRVLVEHSLEDDDVVEVEDEIFVVDKVLF